MGSRGWIAIVAVLGCLLLPSVAHAQSGEPLVIDHGPASTQPGGGNGPVPLFNLLSVKWKSHTLTYYNDAKVFSAAVKKAAAAWNRSGVKATWKPVSKGAADVIIKTNPHIGVSGLATYHDGRSGLIELNPNLKGKSPQQKAAQVGVAAHEMGHIMGLDHASGCATMNASLWSGCKLPKEPWLYHCRALESDDVRGGIAIFGGKAKKLGKENCASEPAPSPVTGLKAVVDNGDVKLSWNLPKKKAPKSVDVVRGGKDGECPKGGKGSFVESGRTSATDFVAVLGTYCYSVVGLSPLGRESKAATVKVTFDGYPPFADFSWSQYDPYVVEFYDYAADEDGDIVSWEWNFGDGSPVSGEREPIHTFAAGGTYTVTLTVRDSAGRSDSVSQQVEVFDF